MRRPDSFQLRDTGGTTFTGTVQDDGRFVVNAVFGPDASGQTFTQRLGLVQLERVHRRAHGDGSAEELRIYEELDRQPATVNGGSRSVERPEALWAVDLRV